MTTITSAILATKAAFQRVGATPPSTIWITEEDGEKLVREANTLAKVGTFATALKLGSLDVAGVRIRWPVTVKDVRPPGAC